MNKNRAIVWIREDFRTVRNDALSYACQNHEEVSAFFIYKKKNFQKDQHNVGGFISLLKILKINCR